MRRPLLRPLSLTSACLLVLVVLLAGGPSLGAPAPDSGPKVVIIEFHGLKQHMIFDNLERLPNFRELIRGAADDHAFVHLPTVVTTVPAASVPSIAAMYTGRHPQETGVVSTIWFDRPSARVRTMISPGQQRINDMLRARGIPTIFEHLKAAGKTSLSCMLMVNTGADWTLRSGAFFWGNASALRFLKDGRWFPHRSYTDPKTVSAFIDGHVLARPDSLSGILAREGRLPDVMVLQLLGTDLDSHFPPPRLVAAQASIEAVQADYLQQVLDPQIGRLIRFFKQTGTYERTIFILGSQQGAVKVTRLIDDGTVARSLRSTFVLSADRNGQRAADAVVMLGACTKEVYLKNRATGDWTDPPRLQADVKVAVDRLLDNPDVTGALNALVVRQYPGERREGPEETAAWWSFDWERYRATPRGPEDFEAALRPLTALAGRFVLADHLFAGLERQYTRDTAPDIKLINKKGVYYERSKDKYGHHGSYYPEDLLVSFWVAGPGVAAVIPGRHTVAATASVLDLIPITFHLLGLPPPTGLAGRNPLAYLP